MVNFLMIDDNPIEHIIMQKMFDKFHLFPNAVHSLDGRLSMHLFKDHCSDAEILPDVILKAECIIDSPLICTLKLQEVKQKMRMDALKPLVEDVPPRNVLVQARFDDLGWKIFHIKIRLVGGPTGIKPEQEGVLKIFAGMRNDYDPTTLDKIPLACAFKIVHHTSKPVSMDSIRHLPPALEYLKTFPLALPPTKSDLFIVEPLNHTLRVGNTHTFRVVPCWKEVKKQYQHDNLEIGKTKVSDVISTSFGTLPRYKIGASGDLNRQIYLVTPKKKKHLLIWNHQQ